MKTLDQKMYLLVQLSLWVLALGAFTSVSFLALHHVLIIAPAGYFFWKTYKTGSLKISPSMWALLAMSVIIALSVIVNLEIMTRPVKYFMKSKYFFIGFFSIFALREYFKNYATQKQITYILRALMIATTVASISGLIGLWTGYNPLKFSANCNAYRNCGLFSMLLTYAYGLSVFLAGMTAFWVHGKEKLKLIVNQNLFFVFMAINLVALYFTYARGAWLGFILALPFLFVKKFKVKALITVVVTSVLVLAAAFFVFKDHEVMNRGYSDTQRIAYYQTALKAFEEKPILGFGYRNFEHNVKKIKARYDIAWPDLPGHAHNNFLEHLASTGGLGALAFLAFFFFWIFEMYKRSDLMGEVGFVFVISFFISGMFQYTFGDSANVFFIMGMYALTQSIFDKPKNAQSA